MRPTLRQLEYLVAVSEHGRISEAARRLNVSQPSLSAQISEAEQALGATVFERGRKGALVTPVGIEIIRRARAVLRQVEDLHAIAAHGHGSGGLYGRVRLGVLPTIGPYLLPRCTATLHAEFPDLRLNIRDDRPGGLQAWLVDGRLDAVISSAEDHPGAVHRPLFAERLWACLPQDDPLAQTSGPIAPSDLTGQPLLTLGLGHRLTALVQDLAHRAGAYVSHDYEGTSLDAIRHMAGLGAGIAILPELYVRCEASRDASVTFRAIDDRAAARDLSLCWRPNSPLEAGLEKLAGLMRVAADAAMKTGDPG